MLARVNCPHADGIIVGLKEGEQNFKFIKESPLNKAMAQAVCRQQTAITATNSGRKAKISLSVFSENPLWKYGVNSASEAFRLSQSAQTFKQWLTVKETWEAAIAFAQNVPPSHPNYATAQQKVREWGKNREVSQQKIEQIVRQKVPALSKNIEQKYYTLVADTIQDLYVEIDRKGSEGAGRYNAVATAGWQVWWTYQYLTTANGCYINPETLEVKVKGVIRMPRWNPPPDTSPSLIQRWQNYVAAVQQHENQHIQHGLEAGQMIREELPKLTAATCNQLETQADTRGYQIKYDHRQKDLLFDKREHKIPRRL
ncbi:MAG: DUF922 domain-containing protein [Spirulina sp.]